jgi:hypothetical protein
MTLDSKHFQADTYVRETVIPRGQVIKTYVHSYKHNNVLASGVLVVLDADGVMTPYAAPCCIQLEANIAYKMLAMTDVIWYCIHKDTSEIPDIPATT